MCKEHKHVGVLISPFNFVCFLLKTHKSPVSLKKQNGLTKLTKSEPTALVGWGDAILASILCQQWWHILVHETLNYNELKRWVVYGPRIAILGEHVRSWTFGDGFTLFPFICWHSAVSLPFIVIQTREYLRMVYYISKRGLLLHVSQRQWIPMVFFGQNTKTQPLGKLL